LGMVVETGFLYLISETLSPHPTSLHHALYTFNDIYYLTNVCYYTTIVVKYY